MPGLLQTEEYAGAILFARPDGNLEDLDEQVAARLARQAISGRTGAAQLWCILDEGVLHRAIGGSKVMRSQLYHLAEVAEHPKTTIQVIRSGGAHAGLLAHFVIADLDGKPPVVYLETAAEGQVNRSTERACELLRVAQQHQVPRRPGHREHVGQRQLARLVHEQGVHADRQPRPRPQPGCARGHVQLADWRVQAAEPQADGNVIDQLRLLGRLQPADRISRVSPRLDRKVARPQRPRPAAERMVAMVDK